MSHERQTPVVVKIKDHILQGTSANKVTVKSSPKTSGKFKADLPDTIVIHFTAGRDAASSVRTLMDPGVQASAHIVLGRDGHIIQLVPFDTIAWHAGRSKWKDRTGLNKYSIGIEIDNAGRLDLNGDEYLSWFKKAYPRSEVFKGIHRNENEATYWHKYTEKQIEITEEICRLLIANYPIKMILGHEEISPGRKTDPGPAFPLDKLRNELLYSDRASDEPEEFSADETDISGQTGEVTASRLNVRSAPGGPKIADPLPKGTKVDVIDKQGNWYKIKFKQEGWVSSDWVK